MAEEKTDSLMKPVASRANLKQLLEANKDGIAAVIPSYLTADKLLKVVMLSAMNNPDILLCTKESILKSVMISAQMGIPIGPQSGHLVPFNRKIKARDNVPEHFIKEVQFIPDYRGLIAQAKRCDAIKKAEAHLVYKDDVFEIDWGNEEKPLTHKPNFRSPNRKPEDVVAGYFRAKLPDGDYQYEVMTKEELDSIRGRSKAKDAGAWVSDTGEMYRKTLTKRGLKYIPNLDDNVVAALEHDNAIDSGTDLDTIGLLSDIASTAPKPENQQTHAQETKSKLETVAAKVAAVADQQTTKREEQKPQAEGSSSTKEPIEVCGSCGITEVPLTEVDGVMLCGNCKPKFTPQPASEQKVETPKVEPSAPPITPAPTTPGPPPWARPKPQQTQPAPVAAQPTPSTAQTSSEPLSLEDQVAQMAAEKAATTKPRIKSKNNPIKKVKLPEFADRTSELDAWTEEQYNRAVAAIKTIPGAHEDAEGQLRSTILGWVGLPLEEINSATLEVLIGILQNFKDDVARQAWATSQGIWVG